MSTKSLILAVTGASGAPIAARLLEVLGGRDDLRLSVLVSAQARLTWKLEAGFDLGGTHEDLRRALAENFDLRNAEVHDVDDMGARIASGSDRTAGMIVAPCSMSTLGAIAHGVTLNLVHRAASVMLKEKRPLILVPRESPLSPVHLQNLLELCRIGVHVVPATLAFYNRPRNVQDLVDFVCARVLDLAGIEHTLSRRWEGRREGTHDPDSRIHGYLG